jgi:hypothetical protein
MYNDLAAWHCGHRGSLQNRRSLVRTAPACKVFRSVKHCSVVVEVRKNPIALVVGGRVCKTFLHLGLIRIHCSAVVKT